MVPGHANVTIKSVDGNLDAFFVKPATGAHPAVLLWTDAKGLRPAFAQMATRLSERGYAVLCVSPRGASAMNTGQFTQLADVIAYSAFLDAQPGVDSGRKLASVGYCEGGKMATRAVSALQGRVAAVASFDGGNLATTSLHSPHAVGHAIDVNYLFGFAENHIERDPRASHLVQKAMGAAQASARVEVYGGTASGWYANDSAAWHPVQAERAWGDLVNLLETSL
jgi:carboxymethylenebutenolidase